MKILNTEEKELINQYGHPRPTTAEELMTNMLLVGDEEGYMEIGTKYKTRLSGCYSNMLMELYNEKIK